MMISEKLALETQHCAVRAEFERQAPSWAASEARPELAWVVDQLELASDMNVLDVAAGTGLFGAAIAPHVRRVTAVDLAPKMLELGVIRAKQRGIKNMDFTCGTAEALPFATASFDLVVTRYSIHHMLMPIDVLSEMTRVCRSGGTVAVVDMVAHENPALARRQNDLERVADPTHTVMLSPSALVLLAAEAGLTLRTYLSRDVVVDFRRWQSHLNDDSPPKRTIRSALEADIAGDMPTGFRPFIQEERLKFHHVWGVAIACRLS